MTINVHVWSGLGEQDGLPVSLEVYHEVPYGWSVWENGDLRDDLEGTIEDITRAYRNHFWEDIDDFKAGVFVNLGDILRRYEHAAG